MSEPSKSSKKKKPKVDRKKKAAEEATKLPDDEAIRKLFPKAVVNKVNKAIDHKPRS